MEERSGLHLREAPTQTLVDVRKALNVKTETLSVNSKSEVAFDLTNKKIIRFPKAKIEVPATDTALAAFGNYLDIPIPFLKRVDPDLQQHILSTIIERTPDFKAHVLIAAEEGIHDVRSPAFKNIDLRSLVDIAGKVIDPKATVVEWWHEPGVEFRLDVVVPEGFDRGIGGDKKVGDITRGGIRMWMNLKNNLTPGAQPYTYRIWCTNGAEHLDVGAKIDGRGASVEDVLAEFEVVADRAFRQVDACIKGLYDLRKQKVDNPERVLTRLLHERRMPDRTIARMVEAVPEIVDNQGHATMFDVVNLITNTANDPAIRRRTNVRRALEQAGGSVVSEHVNRCRTCMSKLN